MVARPAIALTAKEMPKHLAIMMIHLIAEAVSPI